MRSLSWIALAALCLVPIACAKPNAQGKQASSAAVREAYALMDQRETGRAIDILEPLVDREPGNHEARLMLASAYMGQAGIDVLSIHDAFHDILFSRSLSEVLMENKNGQDILGKSELPAPKLDPRLRPAEQLLHKVDEMLNVIRRATVIFNRFPRVEYKQWALLDQALAHLDRLPDVNEVRVYRLFIRLVYLKEVLTYRIIKDPDFGTHDWACRLDALEMREGLGWAIQLMKRASDDFTGLYPKEPSPLARVIPLAELLTDEIDRLAAEAPAGTETAAQATQRRAKEKLRCAD